MWDRVSDPVRRPEGPLPVCSRNMNIAVAFLTIRKTVTRCL